MTNAQRDLNDLIGALRLGSKTHSFDIIRGALKAFNSPAFAAMPPGTDDDAAEFQECITDLVYGVSTCDWDQVRRVVERLDGLFTTVETHRKGHEIQH